MFFMFIHLKVGPESFGFSKPLKCKIRLTLPLRFNKVGTGSNLLVVK